MEGPESIGAAVGSGQDIKTPLGSGCLGNPDCGLGGPMARPGPGDSSGFWHWTVVGEKSPASEARVRFERVGFGDKTGLMGSGAASGTKNVVRFVGAGACNRILGSGFVVCVSCRCEGVGTGVWTRLVDTG